MLSGIKKKLTQEFFGECVVKWGTIFEQDHGFFSEEIDLSLYRKEKHLNLCVTSRHKTFMGNDTFTYSIVLFDPQYFVLTLQKNYNELCKLAYSRGPKAATGSDKIPFFHRIIVNVVHGVKASKLLMDYKNPDSGEIEYRFFGYITRKLQKKITIQSSLDISSGHMRVISGDGFNAILQYLKEYLKEQNGEKVN